MSSSKTQFMLFAATIVAGCGGGSIDTDTATPGVQKTYIASAMAGEVLAYTVDTRARTYSYEILHSAYGLAGRKSSGTLTSNGDGTYSPDESPSSELLPLDNGLLIGEVVLSMNGIDRSVPILGMANPASSVSDIAGTYNYITLQCSNRSNGIYSGCSTARGTLEVVAPSATTATYRSCVGGDVVGGAEPCTQLRTGTVGYTSRGIWTFKYSASNDLNYVIAFRAPNGQRVGWMDFNDGTVYGFGQGFLSERLVLTDVSDVNGTYVFKNTSGRTGTVTLTADPASRTVSTSSGLGVNYNNPWPGMARSGSGTGYGLMAGNGVYVYMDKAVSNHYYEIGVRKQ